MRLQLNFSKQDKSNLITLLILGFALRLYALSQTYLITKDGAFQYIPVVKLFYEGNYLQALLQPQLPLYPFLVSLLSNLTGDFELAGQLVSIIFSLLAVFPLYFIAKSIFGPYPAFWTTLLYLLNPLMLRSSVDVLKEGLFIFLFFSSVYCSLKFLKDYKWTWLIWTVFFAIAGALTRMIAIGVLLLLWLWVGYVFLHERPRDRKIASRYVWVSFFILLILAAFIIPWICGWELLTTKKPYTAAKDIFNRLFLYQWPNFSSFGQRFVYTIGRTVEKAYPFPFLVALFGLFSRLKSKQFSVKEKYLAYLTFALIIFTFPLLDISGRYLLPSIFLFYLWAGFGFVKIIDLIKARFTRYPKLNTIIPITILLVSILPISLQPQRLDKIGRKDVGFWLLEQPICHPLILTNIPRVSYYAQGKHIYIDLGVPAEEILNSGKKAEADYLVIEEKGSNISKSLTLFEQKRELKLILRHPYGKKRRIIYVYEFKQ